MKGCDGLQTDARTQSEFRKAMLTAMVNMYYHAGKMDLSHYHAMLNEIDRRYHSTQQEGKNHALQRTAAQRNRNVQRTGNPPKTFGR